MERKKIYHVYFTNILWMGGRHPCYCNGHHIVVNWTQSLQQSNADHKMIRVLTYYGFSATVLCIEINPYLNIYNDYKYDIVEIYY